MQWIVDHEYSYCFIWHILFAIWLLKSNYIAGFIIKNKLQFHIRSFFFLTNRQFVRTNTHNICSKDFLFQNINYIRYFFLTNLRFVRTNTNNICHDLYQKILSDIFLGQISECGPTFNNIYVMMHRNNISGN